MKKIWLIAPVAISLVLMLWLGGEDPTPPKVEQGQASRSPARPASEAPLFVPPWQRATGYGQTAPSYSQSTREEVAQLPHFRPLTEKEQQRFGRNGPATAPPGYATAPTETPQPTNFYAPEPRTSLQQYQFRPLERGHQRYTGGFPQPLPHPVMPGPTWPATPNAPEQLYGYQQSGFPQGTWANSTLR